MSKAKEILQQCKYIDKKIIALEESKVVCATDDTDGTIDKAITDAKELRLKVISQINSMSDSRLATILLLRYINNYSWEDIADSFTEYDYDYVVKHLHQLALTEFEKFMED